MPAHAPMTAREVYQLLKDVALGIRFMTDANDPSLNDTANGVIPVEIDGWHLVLFTEGEHLVYCEAVRSPDGRVGSPETWQRFGTGPVDFLSQWEREQLEGALHTLRKIFDGSN